MVRRCGTLGVGALLALSLATGCVTTGDYYQDDPPHRDTTIKVLPSPKPAAPPFVVPTVAQGAPTEEPVIKPPEPPPIPPVRAVALTQPPPQTLPSSMLKEAGTPESANEAALLTAVRCAIEKHPTEFLEAIKKYDKTTQSVLVAMVPTVVRLTEGGLDKMAPQERAMLVEMLDQAAKALRTRTPLSIEKVCYCRRIRGYGLYDALADDYQFAAGVEKKHGEFVELYVEARNFVNRRGAKGYEIALAGIVEIYDKQNLLVWRHDFPADADHSQSPRQDYFMNYQFWVPPLLEPGEYKLKVSLHDDNGGPEAKWSVPKVMGFNVQSSSGHSGEAVKH